MADPLRYIGFAQKAGKCISGYEGVSIAVRKGRAKLVVGDETLADNTRKKLESVCRTHDIPLIYLREPGRAAGKEAIMCLAILDDGLAEAIIESQKHA